MGGPRLIEDFVEPDGGVVGWRVFDKTVVEGHGVLIEDSVEGTLGYPFGIARIREQSLSPQQVNGTAKVGYAVPV